MCLRSEVDQAQDVPEGPGAWGDAALGKYVWWGGEWGVGSRLRGFAHWLLEPGLLRALSQAEAVMEVTG